MQNSTTTTIIPEWQRNSRNTNTPISEVHTQQGDIEVNEGTRSSSQNGTTQISSPPNSNSSSSTESFFSNSSIIEQSTPISGEFFQTPNTSNSSSLSSDLESLVLLDRYHLPSLDDESDGLPEDLQWLYTIGNEREGEELLRSTNEPTTPNNSFISQIEQIVPNEEVARIHESIDEWITNNEINETQGYFINENGSSSSLESQYRYHRELNFLQNSPDGSWEYQEGRIFTQDNSSFTSSTETLAEEELNSLTIDDVPPIVRSVIHTALSDTTFYDDEEETLMDEDIQLWEDFLADNEIHHIEYSDFGYQYVFEAEDFQSFYDEYHPIEMNFVNSPPRVIRHNFWFNVPDFTQFDDFELGEIQEISNYKESSEAGYETDVSDHQSL